MNMTFFTKLHSKLKTHLVNFLFEVSKEKHRKIKPFVLPVTIHLGKMRVTDIFSCEILKQSIL